VSRIQRDVPSALPSRTRACHPSGTPALDFSTLLVPGTVETPAIASIQPQADSEADPASVPEHSTPGRRALSLLVEPDDQAGSLLQTVTPVFESTPLSRAASRQAELDYNAVFPTPPWLLSRTEDGGDFAALARPPWLPNLSALAGDSHQVDLSPPSLPLSTAETTPAGSAAPVAPTLDRQVVSELAAEIDQRALESALADPEPHTAIAIPPAMAGAHAAQGADYTLNLIPRGQCQAGRDGALSEAIENLPTPIRSWNGDGDRLFDLTAWAQGLLSYASADRALGTRAEPATSMPTRGPVAPGGPGFAIVAGMAVSPAPAHTEAQNRELRALASEIGFRRAVDVETQTSTRDPPSVPELAEPAAPRQVLLVVRDDSAVLYVRDYFAQSAGLELVVEQVRKLLLTRNRAGLRVVINGHWQTTEQIRRGSDGN
jgi:hypothetical protein